MASSSCLPLSSTDHQNHYTYEVFLSCRGEDTRFTLTDHLYKALCQRGIKTFRGVKLSRGEDISQELLKAIEESRVSIVVFSQNYASSRWCLDELVKILDCRKSKGQVVRSVFYKVDPSDVRKQTGAFGDAFAKIDQRKYVDSMGKWKAALKEAADLSGWSFKDDEYESNFIDRIVEELSTQVINPSYESRELSDAAASSSSSSLPRSSTDQSHYTYEVFLSFQGEDTRYNFTDHLHTALCQRGIKTFRDDKLNRGEDISRELLKAIEESRVSIVVFSQNYASSRWCLDELVKILECRKFKAQNFIPVFYKVAPSDVRHQTGAFGDAFAKIDQCKYKDSMGKWKAALEEAANSSGWTYEEERYETDFINDIVDELSTRVVNPSCKLPVEKLSTRVVNPSCKLPVAEHPIGLESCRQDVNILLHAEENIVRMVGIWGPGGIGKTTIAKDVFYSIRHKFEGSCFLTDFRPRGLAKLQETLLSRILNSTLKVSSVDEGVSFIETKMRHKKILLILDDVSDSSQLEKLVPSPDCFGPGSRILITTRDKHWLIAHEVKVYEVKMLNDHHALELFSLHAFRGKGPPSHYQELAQRAVHYAQGLPLALIVLGSHLFCRSTEEWEATLDSCRGEDTHREIRDILKISYDALEVDLKGYFLDIACFFKGRHVAHVKPILEACYDLKSVIGIAQLQEKALIRIDRDRIWMHDLIEEMGKDIVYQESPGEPGKRSRVWSEEDIYHILTKNTGTNKVIGIQVPWWSSTISLNAKTFSKMKNLGYISMSRMMKYESFSGDIDYLSNQLRWLDWPECPLPCFPSDFHAKKLVNLDISESRGITRLWEGRKNFSWLTCLNLRGCTSLKELPDFIGIPNLKELDLFECTSLVEVPDSIRFLHNLVTLNVRCCSNLIMFPRKINLRSVKTISVSYCKLEEFSEVEEEMSFLTSLDLQGTCIKELRPSITKFIGLEELILGDSQNLTLLPYYIYELRNLKSIDAHNCPKLATFPEIPIEMDSLRELDLRGSDIRELDESIRNLTGLQLLDLSDCKNLTTLPCSIYELQNLQDLTLINCSKLVRFPRKTNILNVEGCSLSLPKLQMFDIGGCSLSDCDFLMTLDCWETLEYLGLSDNNFVSLPACFTKFVNLETLVLDGCKRLREIPELPPNVDPDISGCELLEVRFSTLTNPGAVIKAESPSIEEPTPPSSPSIDLSGWTYEEDRSEAQFIKKIVGDLSTGVVNPSYDLDVAEHPIGLESCIQEVNSLLKVEENIVRMVGIWGSGGIGKYFPSDFHADRLANLNISWSRGITRLWENFSWLTCMNLRGCESLEELPDFSGIPNLKELDLSMCTSLVMVPDSVGLLDKLVTLEVVGCSNLIMFPRKINLKSVETIYTSYCNKLEEFSEVGEEMGSLRRLTLRVTCIKELHPSITRLIRLKVLDLTDSQNLITLPYNIYELHNLKALYASGCSKLATFPKIPVKMDSLRRLSLSGSDIRELDESIKNLIGLERLVLTECKNLTTLPCSIYGLQNLLFLDLSECSKLVRFPTNTNILNVDGCSLSLPKLEVLSIKGCSLLSDCDFLMTLDCWETLQWLNLSRNNFVSLPACFTKFVNLLDLDLSDCMRLREIPELPPNFEPDIDGCESLDERFSTLTNRGAVIRRRRRQLKSQLRRHGFLCLPKLRNDTALWKNHPQHQ